MNAQNPYAPPKAAVADVANVEAAPALWNPNAASSWSLLFSPMFGAYLHMRNWQALGEEEKAAQQKTWIIVYVVFLVLTTIVPFLVPGAEILAALGRPGGLGLLLGWYFASGKPQQKYVQEHFGKTYPRRGWTKPLLSALGLFIAYFVVAVIAVMIGESMRGEPV